jgi:hypothetical protein
MTTVSNWLLWLTGLGVLLNLLLSFWILTILPAAGTPFRTRRELETAYEGGQISWDAYERWASRLR